MIHERQASKNAVPVFTKRQLIDSKTLGLPQDAVAAVLEDGTVYTKDQVISLVQEFLNRRV